MLLAIDAGNTNTVFAVFEGKTLLGQWRISTDAKRTADEYAVWLLQLMERAGVKPERIKHAIVASVVPQTLFDLRTLAKRYFNTDLLVVGEEGLKTGVPVLIDRPSEVGADRVVNACAVWTRYKSAAIVVDFGTATTFDVVSGKGEYIGGVIAPGINLSLEALEKAAARLPTIGIKRPEKVIGTNTVAAMQSGIYFGYVGLIEGIVSRIKAEYYCSPLGGERARANAKREARAVRGNKRNTPHASDCASGLSSAALPQGESNMKVIATGGLAPLYAKATPVIEHLEPDLTILGLRDIFSLNNNK